MKFFLTLQIQQHAPSIYLPAFRPQAVFETRCKQTNKQTPTDWNMILFTWYFVSWTHHVCRNLLMIGVFAMDVKGTLQTEVKRGLILNKYQLPKFLAIFAFPPQKIGAEFGNSRAFLFLLAFYFRSNGRTKLCATTEILHHELVLTRLCVAYRGVFFVREKIL